MDRQCHAVATVMLMDGRPSLLYPSLFQLPRGKLMLAIPSRSLWIMDCLLLLAGDVALNPGPSCYPCTVCACSVGSNQRALCCDMCQRWTHATCGGVSAEQYSELAYQGEFPWCCPSCLLLELPFEIMSAIKEKQRAKRAAERSGGSESVALYKQLKNKLKTTAKLHCLQVLLQQSHKCSHLAAKLWSQIDDMIGRRCRNVASSVDADLSLESINDFFRTVAISVNHQPAGCFHSESSVGNDHFQFSAITANEVCYQLQHLDTQKSTGPDGISALFLNMVASEVADPLTVIFNQSFRTGIVPSAYYPKGALDACAAEQEKLEDSDASDNESIVNSSEEKDHNGKK